jgi:hypothetical protein
MMMRLGCFLGGLMGMSPAEEEGGGGCDGEGAAAAAGNRGVVVLGMAPGPGSSGSALWRALRSRASFSALSSSSCFLASLRELLGCGDGDLSCDVIGRGDSALAVGGPS